MLTRNTQKRLTQAVVAASLFALGCETAPSYANDESSELGGPLEAAEPAQAKSEQGVAERQVPDRLRFDPEGKTPAQNADACLNNLAEALEIDIRDISAADSTGHRGSIWSRDGGRHDFTFVNCAQKSYTHEIDRDTDLPSIPISSLLKDCNSAIEFGGTLRGQGCWCQPQYDSYSNVGGIACEWREPSPDKPSSDPVSCKLTDLVTGYWAPHCSTPP